MVPLTIKSIISENNNRHVGQIYIIRTNATHLTPSFEELYELSKSDVNFDSAN